MAKLIPVIHVESHVQAVREVGTALTAGADGVFLINHGCSWWDLIIAYTAVSDTFPDSWVGVNFLDIDRNNAVVLAAQLPTPPAAVWVDDAGVLDGLNQPAAAAHAAARAYSGFAGLFFGGVAFKYQRSTSDVGTAAAAATWVDVVTTSGPATGYPPSVAKLAAMRAVIGTRPLAVASGVTPENASEIIPWVDYVLAATGISRSFTELDPIRVAALAAACRAAP